MAAATGLLGANGEPAPTIFAEMTALAIRTDAANLGQGFPDADGPEWVREAAVEAIRSGQNQYPPGRGTPELRRAIASHQARYYGLVLDPEREVLVTAGATEALAAAVAALSGPGDEVITLEPFYDAHAAAIALAGATHVPVPLVPAAGSGSGFAVDLAALDRAVGPRTRLILVNSPHNPTGTVLAPEELAAIAHAAARVDATIITDEVYEHLTFGPVHVPLATLPGMAARTLTISSAGKTFSLTGWKIGWITGPEPLINAVATVKQFLTYSGGAPFQPAIAKALTGGADDIDGLRASLAARMELLLEGLRAAGLDPVRPGGTYFVCADASPLYAAVSSLVGSEISSGADFARALPEAAGVACVPVSAFCREGSATAVALNDWVRFTFVKDTAVLRTAIARLSELALRR